MRGPRETSPGDMRPKVKFLTVVWGEAHIKRFTTLALPSFLAPGNLPALAAVTDLEVVIMTARRDIEPLKEYAAFHKLRAICGVRFVEIDDLIATAVYGVTLTLAYARAVIACGADMLDTHFVFMNSDFVLADGSLRSLSKHILAGRSIVIAPSLRATAEALEPRLLSAVNDSAGTLVMAPREMARLALRNLHPTTVAKIVNQGFSHTVHPNQLFWQVDEHTMLGRYYLIFMLCLKPERVVTAINSYCDYGFIPEFCPSGDTAVMSDSDEFLMLELQRRDQEMLLLRLGRQPIEDAARSLGEWTTAEHRRAAGYDLVFHSRDIPPGIENAKNEARVFISRLERALGAPVPHAFHHYWVGGVEAWKLHRYGKESPALPPELGPTLPPAHARLRFFRRHPRVWVKNRLAVCQRAILGGGPRVTPFHPDWLDYRLLRQALGSIPRSDGARLLIVREEPEQVDSLVNARESARFVHPIDVLWGALSRSPGHRGHYTHAFIYLLRKDCRLTRRLIERCRSLMKPDGECQVFIHHLRGEMEGSNFSLELLHYLDDLVPWPLNATKFSFVGGTLKRFNHRLFTMLGYYDLRVRWYALPWVVPALVLALPLALLSNLLLRRRLPSDAFVQYCSSVLIRVGPSQRVPRAQMSRPADDASARTDHVAETGAPPAGGETSRAPAAE